jgi:archaeosine synthase beta-subunit
VAARRGIYDLVRNFPTKKLFIETRPETITQETVAELVTSVPGKRLSIELGLESSCFWVGRFCVNRSHTPEQVSGAIEIINRYRVTSFCNVSLGIAFLSEAEAVSDAVRTIRWALNKGAANVVVFPVHVKPHTLVNELFEMGLYEPPSLWALVEVLKQCADQAHRIEIAWYRSYYDNESKVRRSPHTCARCYNTVLMLLDHYRAEQTSESIVALDAVECPCRNLWYKRFTRHPMLPLPERVFQSYAALAPVLRLESWWNENYREVKADLEESLPLVMESNDLRMEHGNE